MTLIIKNVRKEFLPAFKGLAEGINAKLETQNAESNIENAESSTKNAESALDSATRANFAESSANFAESSANFAESSAESNECPICKEYNYEPNDELLEAIAEFERGEAVHYDSFEDYKARIDSE